MFNKESNKEAIFAKWKRSLELSKARKDDGARVPEPEEPTGRPEGMKSLLYDDIDKAKPRRPSGQLNLFGK